MNSVFIIFALYSLLFHSVLAHPNGAPTGACGSMIPSHGPSAQTGASPYKVTVDKSYYKDGQLVKVTIESSDNINMIKGLLVQARKEGSNTPIGTFADVLPSGVKHLTCTNSKDSVTHEERLNFKNITLEWQPPTEISGMGNISFFATVVKEKATFWVKLQSPKLSPMGMANNMTTTYQMMTMDMTTSYMATSHMATSMAINATKSMPMPKPSSSMYSMNTTCSPKCNANASPPNMLLFIFSALLLAF